MKKLAILFSLVAIVFACKNVDQFRAPIEALTADWEKASTALSGLGTTIGATQTSLASLKDSFAIDPKAKIAPAMMTKLDSIKNVFTTSTSGMESIASAFTTSMTNWTSLSEKVKGLKEGLASGKLNGDVMAQINELKNAVTNSSSEVESYTAKLNTVKTDAMAAYDMFKQTLMAKK
ncbi:MAG TPA: hypothetical protein PK006_06485 [Saprospiraceae bacterium]|nr:hypothetical protein [Saprospiraceae bacterium]